MSPPSTQIALGECKLENAKCKLQNENAKWKQKF